MVFEVGKNRLAGNSDNDDFDEISKDKWSYDLYIGCLNTESCHKHETDESGNKEKNTTK